MQLAIVTTHPIQYQAAWYRLLAARSDLEIHVYYCHQATPMEQAEAGFGVEFDWDVPLLSGYPHSFLKNVAREPGHGRFSGFDTPEIKNIIASRKYDAVMVNGWHYKSAWQAIRACWKAGIKVAVRSDSHLYTPRKTATKMVKALLHRRFIPRLDACLAVGTWSKEYFLHYGAKPERVFIVPHAADNDLFRAGTQRLQLSHHELRQKWSLDGLGVVFAFSGKIVEQKRPMEFVTAIHLAAQRLPAIQGLVIGDGPLRSGCQEFVTAHKIPVKFAGFLNQSQMPSAYVSCDALVLLSHETWGLVVNEAMACGRPAIVSDRTGCGPDLVLAGKTGFVFAIGNVEALAERMVDMAANPRLASEMGVNAKSLIENYSPSAAAQSLVDCLKTILRR